MSKYSSFPCYSALLWSDPSKPDEETEVRGGCSHQLLTFYEAATLIQQGQAKIPKCYYVKIESKVETRGDVKTWLLQERENMRCRGEQGRRDRKGEKSCKTTHSEEKARDYFRWRSLHSSLFIVAIADTRRIMQVSAVLGHALSANSFSKCFHAATTTKLPQRLSLSGWDKDGQYIMGLSFFSCIFEQRVLTYFTIFTFTMAYSWNMSVSICIQTIKSVCSMFGISGLDFHVSLTCQDKVV